jgi:hypothetical protein
MQLAALPKMSGATSKDCRKKSRYYLKQKEYGLKTLQNQIATKQELCSRIKHDRIVSEVSTSHSYEMTCSSYEMTCSSYEMTCSSYEMTCSTTTNRFEKNKKELSCMMERVKLQNTLLSIQEVFTLNI